MLAFLADTVALIGAIIAAYPSYRQLNNLKVFNTFLRDPTLNDVEKGSFSEQLLEQMKQTANSANENDIFWIKVGIALLILSFLIGCFDSYAKI